MSSPALESLRREYEALPNAKFGFIVYRCSYGDDEKWNRFMSYLSTHTRVRLEKTDLGDLFPRIDWNVQSGPELDGASIKQVRRAFQRWTASGEEADDGTSRFHACIMANDRCIDIMLKQELDPEKFDAYCAAWAFLISGKEHEYYTRIGLSYLVPRAYSLLDGPGWEAVFEEESRIAMP